MLAQIAVESQLAECAEITSNALHARSVVALRRGDLGRAVCLAYEALQCAVHPKERDSILGDIGAVFIAMQRFDAARDALMILEATSATEIVRINARVNMVILAARAGDRELFANSRAQLKHVALIPETQVNYLIESARGLRKFGEPNAARQLLEEARELANENSFNRSVFEADEMLEERDPQVQTTSGGTRFEDAGAAAGVEQELRKMALGVS